MSMSKKLYASFGFILAMVVVLFFVTWFAVHHEQSTKEAASQASQMTDTTAKVRSQIMLNQLYLNNYLLSGDSHLK